tara:strand:+ start:6487 stop:6711 length:225 start_codon:yes stop_codon:yes gene_type:complete
MVKLVPVKSRTLLKLLLSIGFIKRDAEGSHVFLRHPDGRTTTIPTHKKELSKGLLRKILNDVKLTKEEYEELRN